MFDSAIRRHENCTSSTGSRTNDSGPPDNQVIDVDIPFDVRTLHVRLEGSSDQESPVLVFLNELLTDMHIWDSAISLLKQDFRKFVFFDMVGKRTSNKKLVSEWDSRLHYARTYGMSGVLANKVVAIWFTADSRGSPEWERVREMVGSWSLDDFEATAKAQYSYDETEKMRTIQIPGLFVVGSEDGILPEVMSAFPEKMRIGMATFKEIKRAGHLPMLENADAFVIALTSFLAGTIATND